jgi:5-(carboxyamino)imidazole ribonucleotide synthase
MNPPFSPDFRLGILGGGQLGKMLLQPAHQWNLRTQVLDPDEQAPARALCADFFVGPLTDYDAVMAFGESASALTIEIENVNAEALAELADRGIPVHPDPRVLPIIQDKGLQRQFLDQHDLPCPRYELFADAEAVRTAVDERRWKIPFVQKLRTGGYDGRGVLMVRTDADLDTLMDAPCLLEALVPIHRELAVIAARNPSGHTACYPTAEMEFHPEGNLVELLLCPADITSAEEREAEALAVRTIEALGLCGLLAVELFLDLEGRLLVNEVAPRPHNSGHHTIEAAATSQYEQHLRAILDLPLGPTDIQGCAAMVNLLGEPGHQGPPVYQGVEECLATPGAHLHIYGKPETRPFRKMGHVTVVADNREQARTTAQHIQETLRVIT